MLAAAFLAVALACPQQPDKLTEFLTQYESALAAKDVDGIDKALQRHKEQAIDAFLLRADNRSAAPTSELDAWVDGFIASWDRNFRSSFARNYDRYLQLLDQQRRTARARLLRESLHPLNVRHVQAIEKREAAYWQPIQVEAESLVRSLEQTGDLYFTAFALNILGNSWHQGYNEKGGDSKKAVAAYTRCLEARDKLGLTNDVFYAQVKSIRAELMSSLGMVDSNAPAETTRRPAAPPETIPPLNEAELVSFALASGVEDKPERVSVPSDLGDLDRCSWLQARVKEPGTEVELPFLAEPKVRLRRKGFNEFVLEAGGAPSKPFSLSPKPALVTYERKHADGKLSQHALLLAGGSEQDSFQGATLNLGLHGDQGAESLFFFRAVATRVAETPYGELVLFDLNSDGLFGHGELKPSGEFGLPPDTWPMRYDAVMLGKGKKAVPYSPWFPSAKGEWFEIQNADYAKAEAVRLRPVAPKLGTLKLQYKAPAGMELVSLVFRSETRVTAGLRVDIAGGKGGATALPIGVYLFEQGLLRSKDGGEAMIFPPLLAGEAIRVNVEEGQTATLAMGGPFTLTIDGKIQGKQLTLNGSSLHARGSAGERYARLVGEPLFDVEVQHKGGKTVKLAASTTETMGADWNRCYTPQDAVLYLKDGEAKPSFKLVLKKHPWFGNVESDWIEVEA